MDWAKKDASSKFPLNAVTVNTPEPCDECRNLFFGDFLEEDKKTREVVCRLDLELGKPGCPRFDLVKQTVQEK